MYKLYNTVKHPSYKEVSSRTKTKRKCNIEEFVEDKRFCSKPLVKIYLYIFDTSVWVNLDILQYPYAYLNSRNNEVNIINNKTRLSRCIIYLT